MRAPGSIRAADSAPIPPHRANCGGDFQAPRAGRGDSLLRARRLRIGDTIAINEAIALTQEMAEVC